MHRKMHVNTNIHRSANYFVLFFSILKSENTFIIFWCSAKKGRIYFLGLENSTSFANILYVKEVLTHSYRKLLYEMGKDFLDIQYM